MRRTLLQRFALAYAIFFIGLVLIGYLPGVRRPDGTLFGLYHVDLIDDILHLGSGLWALFAGLKSQKHTLFYFRVFGILYFLDGICGLFTGYNFLNLHIFTDAPAVEATKKLPVNLPHIILGGSQVLLGIFHTKINK